MNSRPFTDDDFGAVLQLLRADEEHLQGAPSRVQLDDLRVWLSRTNLAEDTRIYEEDGRACAVAWLDVAPGGDVAIGIGVVHPDSKRRGLGSEIVAWCEERARARGVKRLHQLALGKDDAAPPLIRAHGFHEVRRFYEMAIELAGRPALPDVQVERFDEREAQAFHAALDEAFQDHWEHHGDTFEEWWGRHTSSPNFDPSLWFLIRDGAEIAAVTRNEANRNGGGYVGAIGVRRPYRGKGYAKALLLRTFAEFWDRGVQRVTLGVDAQSPTGATHLYERVGMHVEQENVVFEKTLAG